MLGPPFSAPEFATVEAVVDESEAPFEGDAAVVAASIAAMPMCSPWAVAALVFLGAATLASDAALDEKRLSAEFRVELGAPRRPRKR
jgi:hypothetical protein